jgi:hypothetical protein
MKLQRIERFTSIVHQKSPTSSITFLEPFDFPSFATCRLFIQTFFFSWSLINRFVAVADHDIVRTSSGEPVRGIRPRAVSLLYKLRYCSYTAGLKMEAVDADIDKAITKWRAWTYQSFIQDTERLRSHTFIASINDVFHMKRLDSLERTTHHWFETCLSISILD